jgi:hypothetical protein
MAWQWWCIPYAPRIVQIGAPLIAFFPLVRLKLHATPSISPLPKSYKSALLDPHWSAAMKEEFEALLYNHTWQLVPRPSSSNVVSGKWVFRQKFHSDGSLSLYKE